MVNDKLIIVYNMVNSNFSWSAINHLGVLSNVDDNILGLEAMVINNDEEQ